ncbi:MAG: proton-conducting transporter membrane subunit [Rickettsiales bacterium]|nr:proton-conducting transporter membrane subunit [Rickettsiales bacterium]
MIELILLLPIIASLFLVLTPSKIFSSIILKSYGIVHLFCTINIVFFPQKMLIPFSFFDGMAIYFQVDPLNKIFLLVLSTLFAGVVVYNDWFLRTKELDKKRESYYTIMLLMFIFSMTGATLSNHLGMSWVFIEATTLSTTFAIYFSKTKNALLATWKYIFLCSIGISLALIGINLLLIGFPESVNLHNNSLFFQHLYDIAPQISPFWLQVSFVFILIGIGTKVGLFPLYAWLPDAHSESPSPVSALLSGALLNTALLLILRMYKVIEIANLTHYINTLMLIIGFASILISAINILRVNNYKRLLAYSSIENMGIILIGVAAGGVGIFAAMLHLVSHSLLKSAFFLTSGNILHLYKTKNISEVNSLIRVNKTTGLLWISCFIGIVGLPPSPIFISEWKIISVLWEKGYVFQVLAFTGLLTIILFGFANKILKMCFGPLKVKIDIKESKFHITEHITQIIFVLTAFSLGVYMPKFIYTLLINASLFLQEV